MNKEKEFIRVRKELKSKLWKGAQTDIFQHLQQNGVQNISAQVIRNYFTGLSVDMNHIPLIVKAARTVIKEREVAKGKILKTMKASV